MLGSSWLNHRSSGNTRDPFTYINWHWKRPFTYLRNLIYRTEYELILNHFIIYSSVIVIIIMHHHHHDHDHHHHHHRRRRRRRHHNHGKRDYNLSLTGLLTNVHMLIMWHVTRQALLGLLPGSPAVKLDPRGSFQNRAPVGGRLNKKDGLTRYGNSHVKDKTS